MQTFFDDSDEDVSADRDPYLRLDGILAGSQKSLDTQMLLDPFEEQFDLPALLIKCRDHLWLERKVVGQKSDALSSLNFVLLLARVTKNAFIACNLYSLAKSK